MQVRSGQRLFCRQAAGLRLGKDDQAGVMKLHENRFLEALKLRSGYDLAKECEPVQMPLGMLLFDEDKEPRYVHFITSGMASIVSLMRSGSAVEICMYGYEGFPECGVLLGPLRGSKRGVMQVGGTALRMSLDRFRKRFLQDEITRDLVLRLLQFENLATGQVAACNGLHEVEDRLSRWLLMVQDRLESPDLPLTQEFLGDMLGARRATVTMIAGNLQRAGLIEYHRGLIRIQDRDRLEDVACECYGVLSDLRNSLFK